MWFHIKEQGALLLTHTYLQRLLAVGNKTVHSTHNICLYLVLPSPSYPCCNLLPHFPRETERRKHQSCSFILQHCKVHCLQVLVQCSYSLHHISTSTSWPQIHVQQHHMTRHYIVQCVVSKKVNREDATRCLLLLVLITREDHIIVRFVGQYNIQCYAEAR